MSTLSQARPAPRPAQRRVDVRRWLPSLSREAWLLWLAIFLFNAALAWWLIHDNRIPEWDSGLHLMEALYDHAGLLQPGQRLSFFTGWDTYPFLVPMVGGLATFVFGFHPMALMLVSSIVFMSIFAFSCYGIGCMVAGRKAGLLAGIFALGMPMIASMAHTYNLDPGEAAMVAAAVWALLASDRFRDIGLAAVAGVVCGLAMLTKETAIIFFAGMVPVMLLRGGWRNWLGFTYFGILLLVVGGPWYIYHGSDIKATFFSIAQLYVDPARSPPRWSLTNFEWYFWCLMNQQALLPFTLAAVVGTVIAVKRSITRFTRDNVLPELLAGGVFSYLVMTYLTHKDPRYSLPLLVYVAVMGTFWMVGIRHTVLRRVVIGGVIALAALSVESMQIGIGGIHRAMIPLPGGQSDNLIFPYKLTVYENQGWLRGPPQHDADARWLIRGLKREGYTTLSIDQSVNDLDFSELGLTPVAFSLGVQVPQLTTENAPGPAPHEVFLLLRSPQAGGPPPCMTLTDGNQIFAVSGDFSNLNPNLLKDTSDPRKRFSFVCPGRPTLIWPPPKSR
jgi:hypothetical protein